MSELSRYSRRDFPAYRHVPGRTPHPIRDPAGHSFGCVRPPLLLSDDTWAQSQDYLFAIDLFNHGYYWESHEAFEALWHGAGRDTPLGLFAQGVIQAAASLLKHAMGRAASAHRLADAATRKLRAGPPVVLGVAGHRLADDLTAYLNDERRDAPTVDLAQVR